MIEGRMGNFYAEHVLEEQPFVRDETQTVGALAKEGGMKVKRFIRWQLGEAAGGELSQIGRRQPRASLLGAFFMPSNATAAYAWRRGRKADETLPASFAPCAFA